MRKDISNMKFIEETIEKKYIYKGKIINLRNDIVKLPNDKQAQREVVEHPGGVCVVALTSEGEVLLVNQYRYPYEQLLLEVPAGKLDKGEDPFACGVRELKEETGAVAENYISLGIMYPSPGYTDEKIYMYLATLLTYGENQLDDDEFLDLIKMPLQQAVDMVVIGELCDAKTQIAILKTKVLVDKGEVKW